MTVKLTATDIHITYTVHIWQTRYIHNALVSILSDLNISTSRWSLSSSGTIFHTLQYRKEFQQKWVILTQLTEKSV